MYQHLSHGIFVIQIMTISGIIKTKSIAKRVIRSKLHTAFNTFIMCNTYGLRTVLSLHFKSSCFHPGHCFDLHLPLFTVHLEWCSNQANLRLRLLNLARWTEIFSNAVAAGCILYHPRHLYPIVVPYQSVAWFLHFDQIHTVNPVMEGGDRLLASVHHHHPTIKNTLILWPFHPSTVACFNLSVLFSSCWCLRSCSI